MSAARATGIGLLIAFMASCTAKPIVSDTGYQGTWSRGNERIRSTVAILMRGDEVWFRWGQRSEDGNIVVRCEWNGHCEETWGTEKFAEYEFHASLEPANGKLRVEVSQKLLKQGLVIHWIDELTVTHEGKVLFAQTIERDGVVFHGDGPSYEFSKVADLVTDPPDGLSGGTNSPLATRTH